MKPLLRVSLALALTAVAGLAQEVISARSGMIHYIEGSVYVGNHQVESKFGSFPEVGDNAVLRTTAEGRAEVLLTPGVFLRVGEQSSFRMIDNRLTDTRLEFLSGSVVMEADDLPKDNAVTVVYQGYTLCPVKKGLYRLDSAPPTLHVFDGEMTVAHDGQTVQVKEGRMLAFESPMAVAKFDKNGFDALDRWSRQRGAVIAMANPSSANSIRQSGLGWGTGGWTWNPYFGMFTFIPADGYFMSPYGYRFWSPGAVYQVYQPIFINAGRGHGGGGWAGTSNRPVYSAMPATTATRAASEPARSSGGGFSRMPSAPVNSAPSGGLRGSGGAAPAPRTSQR